MTLPTSLFLLIPPLVMLFGCSSQMPPPELPMPIASPAGPIQYEWAGQGSLAALEVSKEEGVVISFDPDRWREVPPAVRVFAIAHELGHFVAAEEPDPWQRELLADCWGGLWMIQANYMDAVSMVTVVEFLQSLQASENHPPGAVRAHSFVKCLTQ